MAFRSPGCNTSTATRVNLQQQQQQQQCLSHHLNRQQCGHSHCQRFKPTTDWLAEGSSWSSKLASSMTLLVALRLGAMYCPALQQLHPATPSADLFRKLFGRPFLPPPSCTGF